MNKDEKAEQQYTKVDSHLFPREEEVDISHELYRTYHFPNNEKVKVNEPKTIIVTEHSHRITDKNGSNHHILNIDKCLRVIFKVRDGEKNWFIQKTSTGRERLTEDS